MTGLLEETPLEGLSFDCLKQHIPNVDIETVCRPSSVESIALSDQCPQGTTVHAQDGKVSFSGSVIKQYNDVLEYIDENNPRIRRHNQPGVGCKFPQNAIRESICNAIIHRDYSVPDDIEITLSDELIVIDSPGSIWFPQDWNIKIWSEPRNVHIGRIMCSLGNARMTGNGLRIIKDSYRRSGAIPGIVAKDDCFIVSLPSLGEIGDSRNTVIKVSDYLGRNPGSSVDEISDVLLVSMNHAKRILQKMEDEGDVFGMGRGNKRRYYLSKQTSRIDCLQ